MKHNALSIRPFIGAKDYEISRSFYRDLGFEEIVISPDMCLFKTAELGFYLQKAYVKEWINNSMLFMEVEDVKQFYSQLIALDLSSKYKEVRIVPIRELNWGSECFVHDPSGVLWHFGEFKK